MTINLLLIDDHAIVREGLKELLNKHSEFEIIGSSNGVDFALGFPVTAQIDIALIDIAMPEMNGIEFARALRRQSEATKMVMLSMHSSIEYVYAAIQAGALGYILKSEITQTLVEAIHHVQTGKRYLSTSIDSALLERLITKHRAAPHPLSWLSSRERTVLQLTTEGLSLRDSAKRLGVSAKTIETYRGRLMAKLGITHIPGLVKFAIRHGITTIDH